MKTKKFLLGFLLITLLLCSCNGSSDQPSKSTSEVISSEQPFSEETEQRFHEYDVIESRQVIVNAPLENQIFTDYNSWKQTVEECDIDVLNECLTLYNPNFFETHGLAVISKSASGGMQYNVEGIFIEDSKDSKVLQVQASYSTDAMVNSLSSYYFFVTLEKQEALDIAELALIDYCRDSLP